MLVIKQKKFFPLKTSFFLIRNYIVTEIMQATAIKNLLKEGVISNGNGFIIEKKMCIICFILDSHQARLGTKGELLMNRDLTKYLNQLRRAKIVCERCITANGGRSYLLVDASTNKINLANRKVKYELIK
jgi:hypothetical protein